MSVIVNNPLELTCIASGIPAPKITWMKDGRPLPQVDQMQTLGGGEVLRISNAQVSSEFIQLFSGLNFLLANLWEMLEKLSWSQYITDLCNVSKGRLVLWHAWLGRHLQSNMPRRKKWNYHIKHRRKQVTFTLIFASFHSSISDNRFPKALNLCHVALYRNGKKQSNIHICEASESTFDL